MIDPGLWKQIEKLFNEVVDLPKNEQAAFLEEACGDQSLVLEEVLILLKSHDKLNSDFLEESHRSRLIGQLHQNLNKDSALTTATEEKDQQNPLTALALWSALSEEKNVPPPQNLRAGALPGPYQLEEVLGEGGMGAVYKATQTTPVRRTVAIKILHHTLSPSARQRFQTEAQALSLLSQHPNIATFFEAGATETGLPFLVMELIPGLPITKYCDKHCLTIDERLSLFLKTCEGVIHAHLNGVIHRDIKPSNILVCKQDQAVPKLIDFGIAKVVDPELKKQWKQTSTHMLLGTPLYMSPEQATGSKGVDTRTDIYALGVLLYELVCGLWPYHIPEGENHRLSPGQIITSQEPLPLLRRYSMEKIKAAELAKQRKTTPLLLKRVLRQDLNWIVLKAIDKDPSKRYQSVGELAADLKSYMNKLPVQARAPSSWYYLRTFAKRKKYMLLGLFSVFVILGAYWQSTKNHLARIRRAEADEKMGLAFIASVLETADTRALGPKATVLEVLENAENRVSEMFKDSPNAERVIRSTIGNVYLNHSSYHRALYQLQKAHAILNASSDFGPNHAETLRLQTSLAILDHRMGNTSTALRMLEKTAATQEKVLGDRHPDYLINLATQANFHRYMQDYAESVMLHEHVLNIMATEPKIEPARVLATMVSYAMALSKVGRLDEAISLLAQTREQLIAVLGKDHPDVWTCYQNEGTLLAQKGEISQARQIYGEVLQYRIPRLTRNHQRTVETLRALANAYSEEDRLDEALPLLREVLAFKRKTQPHHPELGKTMNQLADILKKTGQFKEAEQILLELLAFRIECRGPVARGTLIARNNLADLYLEKGQFHKAEPLAKENLDLRIAEEGESTGVVYSLLTLGQIWEAMGKDSMTTFKRAWEISQKTNPSQPLSFYCKGLYGKALANEGKNELGCVHLTESLAAFPDPNLDFAQEIRGICEKICPH